jgi:hypothetical protein
MREALMDPQDIDEETFRPNLTAVPVGDEVDEHEPEHEEVDL